MSPNSSHKSRSAGYSATYRAKHPDRVKASKKKWTANNKDYARAWINGLSDEKKAAHNKLKRDWGQRNRSKELLSKIEWQKRNPVKSRECSRRWRAKNTSHVRSSNSQWRSSNPEAARARSQRRRARRNDQSHPETNTWLEMEVFKAAKDLTARTGIVHEVDHIIPIHLGGFHHHLNLQALPKKVNILKKANPFWEMAGYKSWRDVPEYLWPEKLAPSYLALRDQEDAKVISISA